MKYYTFVLFLCSFVFFGQSKQYSFDKLAVFNSKIKNLDKIINLDEYSFYNSNNKEYILHFHKKNDTLFQITLTDYKLHKNIHFDNVIFIENMDFTTIFINPVVHNTISTIKNSKKVRAKFVVTYNNDTKNEIKIIEYENSKKIKVLNQYELEYENSEFFNNHIYTIPSFGYLNLFSIINVDDSIKIKKYYYKKENGDFEMWDFVAIEDTKLILNIPL